MTVKNLKDFLERYADHLEVKICIGRKITPIDYASHCVDIDTNEVNVWLCYVGEGD